MIKQFLDLLLNLNTLLIQLREICSKWKEIGAALGISQEYLTKIKDVGVILTVLWKCAISG